MVSSRARRKRNYAIERQRTINSQAHNRPLPAALAKRHWLPFGSALGTIGCELVLGKQQIVMPSQNAVRKSFMGFRIPLI